MKTRPRDDSDLLRLAVVLLCKLTAILPRTPTECSAVLDKTAPTPRKRSASWDVSFNIFVAARGPESAMASIRHFLERRMRLKERGEKRYTPTLP
jgi:hypothetical protein